MAINFISFDELFAPEYQLTYISTDGYIDVGPNIYSVFHNYTMQERQVIFQVCEKYLPWEHTQEQEQWERTMYMYQFVIKSPPPFPYEKYPLSKDIIMINEKYSFKDFMDKDLTKLPASDFNNSEIIGSAFYIQEELDSQVFPSGITRVKFTKCALDNVFIPPGNIIQSNCSHRKVKTQNDLELWIVDDFGKPIEPANIKKFEILGMSIDPKDIPTDFIRKEIIAKAIWFQTKNLPEVTDWFFEIPQVVKQETRLIKKEILKAIWDSSFDKTRWLGDYDTAPVVTQETIKAKDFIVLSGNITKYTIKGKGKFYIKGKGRFCENVPASAIAAQQKVKGI